MAVCEPVLPTFLIPGAGKGGTSYLTKALEAHPDVFIPYSKEPAFFSTYKDIGRYGRGMDYYQRNFVGYAGQRHVGEASTVYMYDPASPSLIRKHLPCVKLVFLLRNPVERVYSNYWQELKAGRRPGEFRDLLMAGNERISEMIEVSRYDVHLRRYYDAFPKDDILVLLHDELRADALGTVNRVLMFLGLEPFSAGGLLEASVNPSSLPRSRMLARIFKNTWTMRAAKGVTPGLLAVPLKRLLERLRSANQRPFEYPPMDDVARDRLRMEFRDNVETLSRMLGRDLSHWLG